MKKLLLTLSLVATTALSAVTGCGGEINTTTSKSPSAQTSHSSSLSDSQPSAVVPEENSSITSETTPSASSSASSSSASTQISSSEVTPPASSVVSTSQESSESTVVPSVSSENISSASSSVINSEQSSTTPSVSSNTSTSTAPSVSSAQSSESSSVSSSQASTSQEVSTTTSTVTSTSTSSSSSNDIAEEFTITWIVDGVSTTTTVAEGETPVYNNGVNPTKEATAQYTFTFTGWDKEVVAATKNETYTAQFSQAVNEYTITWVIDGASTTDTLAYGETPDFGRIPTKEATAQYTYTFTGWSPEIVSVTQDATYTAQFSEVTNSYTITWIVDGASTTTTVAYGSTPTFSGSTYKYGYEFTGWDKEIVAVTGGATYTAQYTDTSVWNGTYPTVTNGYTFKGEGTQNSPYLIESATDLAALSRLTTGKTNYGAGTYYKLTINVDLSCGGWVPICDKDTTAGGWHSAASFFTANFDGSNKTITFNETNVALCFGLFQGLANCTVENIVLNGNISGQHYHAALATYFNGGVLAKNITNNVNITVSNTNDAQARTGGIVGQINGSGNKLINCVNNGNITALSTQTHVGGLVGFAYGETTLENCSNTGDIKAKITAVNDFGSSSDYVGKLIGAYVSKTFTISWSVAGEVTSSTVAAGDMPTFTGSTTITGYEFKGWSTTDGGEVTGMSAAVKDTTYYAVLEQITTKYTVSWIVDGVTETETVLHGSTPSRAKPTLANHVFSGWSTSVDGELVDLDNLTITQDIEFYAVFDRLLESEFRAQVAHYGGPSGTTNNKRMRLSFSIKMKAGTTFEFIGSSTLASTYKWTVNETQNTANMYASTYIDAGWNTDPKTTDAGKGWNSTTSATLYTTQTDCYPVIVLARIDGVAFTNEEVDLIKTMFKVKGTKLSPLTLYEEGTLTTEEFNSQVAGMGSFHQPVSNTRGRIMFSIRMAVGTKVSFIGDSSVYNWAVVETGNHVTTDKLLDSGWNTTWTDTTAPYYTQIDGSYLVITVKKANDGTFDNTTIATLHSLFKVEGQKRTSFATQETYDITSINHRGQNYLAPENTLEAYTLSAMSGFTHVECDISFTKDNVPVLLHDETIDRTSNGTGNIADLTLAEARQYDYGSWFSSEWTGVQIPTLEEFLLLCKKYNLHPYIEIKWNNSFTLNESQAQIIVDLVEKCGMKGKVSYISFNISSLAMIAALDDTARLGYVYSSTLTQDALNKLIALKTDTNSIFMDVYVSQGAKDHATVTMCKNAGVPLEVWTADGSAIDTLDPYVTGISSEYTIAGKYLQSKVAD